MQVLQLQNCILVLRTNNIHNIYMIILFLFQMYNLEVKINRKEKKNYLY